MRVLWWRRVRVRDVSRATSQLWATPATPVTEPRRAHDQGLLEKVNARDRWRASQPRRRPRWRRLLYGQRPEPLPSQLGPIEEPRPGKLGICCSGGGIRSAAFNLGALQVLQEEGELRRASYLAAVSGGSYIAAAFSTVG